MISVLILTLNEELNLPACLKSVAWSDDIVVFDSHSSDRTIEIANAAGARVIQRPFDNERDHRAAALKVKFKHPWVYNPDADEVTPPDLRDEMMQTVTANPEVAGFRVRYKNMFMGRWIKHSSLYPTWVMRLFRPERVSFDRTINLRYKVDGSEGRLKSHFEHYSFNKGIEAWIEKHNRYSTHEAREGLASSRSGSFSWRDLLFGDAISRRRALKELSFRLPCRRLLRFVYTYFFRMGFLDGYPGLTYCRLISLYEYMIEIKMKELRRRERNLGM